MSAARYGMKFFQFYPSDWRTGCTTTLTLEEEGLYIRGTAYMMDTFKMIPGDDREAARALNVQVQKYQKVMEALIGKGKMMRCQGGIINERVMEKIDEWKLEHAARSTAAKKREADRKAQALRATPPPQQPPRHPPHQPMGGGVGQPPDVRGEVSASLPNEINNHDTTAVPPPQHSSDPISRIQKLEKREELASLNGAADLMIADIISWMNGGDRVSAENWLSNSVHIYGSEILSDAYAKLKADQATGKIIARPLPTWTTIAARLRSEGGKPKASAESRAERITRFVKEAEEKNRRHQP